MTPLSRRQFVSSMSAGAAGLAGISRWPFGSSTTSADEVVATTAYGKLRGARENGVSAFLGVPYAGRVSGDRRFRRPAPLAPWTGVRDALRLGPPAIQAPRAAFGRTEPLPAEDCLVLNVWTPSTDGGRRPVMFYNHGGGFFGGSGGSTYQSGANLARLFDVVVVETNHRLGLLGFLYLDDVAGEEYAGSGNNGILDIVDGLRWVHENIAAFGGDPSNVMIFGESGGGQKTSCLYAMPTAAPYFHKASIESGPGVRMCTREIAAETTAMLLGEMGVPTREWRRVLETSAADLLALQLRLPETAKRVEQERARSVHREKRPAPVDAGGFAPVVDGVVLPSHPFEPSAPAISRVKPLIVGWNEDEYTYVAYANKDTSGFGLDDAGLRAKLEPRFGADAARIVDTYRKSRPSASATELFVEIESVTMMGLGSIEIAERKTVQGGAPAYLYNLGYKSGEKVPGTDYPMGSPHAMDIGLKFNNVTPSTFLMGNRPERLVASRNMAELWATFARTGSPAAAGQPAWPAYDLKRRATMRIDAVCEVIDDRNHTEREMWRELGYLAALRAAVNQ
jgi:para-nitrobenzyl esterase